MAPTERFICPIAMMIICEKATSALIEMARSRIWMLKRRQERRLKRAADDDGRRRDDEGTEPVLLEHVAHHTSLFLAR